MGELARVGKKKHLGLFDHHESGRSLVSANGGGEGGVDGTGAR